MPESTKSIQELAGHKDLSTTQRNIHISPAAVEDAIRLLDGGYGPVACGTIRATGSTEKANGAR